MRVESVEPGSLSGPGALDAWSLALDGRTLVRHSADEPWLHVGRGRERMEMYRGNFAIEDHLLERVPLPHVTEASGRLEFRRHAADCVQVALEVEIAADRATLRFVEDIPLGPGDPGRWGRLRAGRHAIARLGQGATLGGRRAAGHPEARAIVHAHRLLAPPAAGREGGADHPGRAGGPPSMPPAR